MTTQEEKVYDKLIVMLASSQHASLNTMQYKDKEKLALYISSEILKIQGKPEKQAEFNLRVKAYFELYESLTNEEQNILSVKVDNIIQRNERKNEKKTTATVGPVATVNNMTTREEKLYDKLIVMLASGQHASLNTMEYKDKEKLALYISSEILKIQGNPKKQAEFNLCVKAYFELYESLTDEEQNILSVKIDNIIQKNKRKAAESRSAPSSPLGSVSASRKSSRTSASRSRKRSRTQRELSSKR